MFPEQETNVFDCNLMAVLLQFFFFSFKRRGRDQENPLEIMLQLHDTAFIPLV